MGYSQVIRKEWRNINGIERTVDVPHWELDPVESDVEELATRLFEVTVKHHGSTMVPFSSQTDEVRDYHHDLARTALGRPSSRSFKPAG